MLCACGVLQNTDEYILRSLGPDDYFTIAWNDEEYGNTGRVYEILLWETSSGDRESNFEIIGTSEDLSFDIYPYYLELTDGKYIIGIRALEDSIYSESIWSDNYEDLDENQPLFYINSEGLWLYNGPYGIAI